MDSLINQSPNRRQGGQVIGSGQEIVRPPMEIFSTLISNSIYESNLRLILKLYQNEIPDMVKQEG